MNSDERDFNSFIRQEQLCEHCRGLVLGVLEESRAQGPDVSMTLPSRPSSPRTAEECFLCSGLFDEVEDFVRLILKAVEEHEYETFLVGLVLDDEVFGREEEFFKEIGEKTGSGLSGLLEKELKIAIGKRIEDITGKEVDFHRPDIMMILDTRYDDVRLQLSSIYIYGRYKKLVRGIPQTIWHCKKCYGRGCHYCNFTGKFYETSVQELVGERFLELTGGTKASFHGMGREDIDARMLGNGRPFVLEIKEPKKRLLDYHQLENESNVNLSGKIELTGLRPSSHDEVVKIKASDHAKRYLIHVSTEAPVDTQRLEMAIHTLHGAVIQQETPKRVKHRRADKVRERRVLEIEGRIVGERGFELEVKGESGLYIKELVHGDEGRTLPNLSELLGNKCTVDDLDVVWVYDGEDNGDTCGPQTKES